MYHLLPLVLLSRLIHTKLHLVQDVPSMLTFIYEENLEHLNTYNIFKGNKVSIYLQHVSILTLYFQYDAKYFCPKVVEHKSFIEHFSSSSGKQYTVVTVNVTFLPVSQTQWS